MRKALNNFYKKIKRKQKDSGRWQQHYSQFMSKCYKDIPYMIYKDNPFLAMIKG